MQKTCKKCTQNFEITKEDLEFYKKISPKIWEEKIEIPAPTLCPDCRQQRRLAFRNERNLFRRKCDATGENIIGMYSPDKNYKIYDKDFWWSDKWDALDYWMNFDFSKSFFEQFRELQLKVPRLANFHQWENEKIDYTNLVSNSSESYLIFTSNFAEKCIYGVQYNDCSNSVDCLNVKDCELCYELVNSKWSYKCFYSSYLFDCSECSFSYNLENCQNCFLSTNISGWQYYFLNKKVEKDEYKKLVEEYKTKYSNKELFEKLQKLKKETFHKNYSWINNENCSWDYIFNNKNCKNLFEWVDCENVSYSQLVMSSKDCMDYSYWGRNSELIYECQWLGYNCSNILFSTFCANDNSNLIYCDYCNLWNSNLFWCIGLKNKEYCIFNKQYTKEEYEILVPKIIEKMKSDWEWWEFFPANLSPFWYNETVAQEYFPLTEEQAQKLGFNYSEYEPPFPKVDKIIPAEKLPEDISKIPDDILNWVIKCEVSEKPFRIIKQELEFYRKHNLPVPHKHPDVRHSERMKLRNPRKLFDRKCDKCGKEIKSTYAPDREEIVYCEVCYEKEVY